MRIALLYSFLLLWPPLASCSEAATDATVSGKITVLSNVSVKVGAAVAKLIFRSADGQEVVAYPDNGEYEAVLKGGRAYTAALLSYSLCNIQRPLFSVNPGQRLRLDFTTTLGKNINFHVEDQHVVPHPSREHPFYDEKTIPVGSDAQNNLIVGFGIVNVGDTWEKYESLPIGSAGGHLPVTISFDLYTISADTAVLDKTKNILRAEGNVSIADGTGTPPRTASCVMLLLKEAQPHVELCLPKKS